MHISNKWKEQLFIIVVTAMIVSWFVSRALLSITSVLLVAFIFRSQQLENWKRIALAAALIICPVIISGLWSEDKVEWLRAVEVKIPLLTIALGIAASTVSLKMWRTIVLLLLMLVTVASFWSAYQFISNYHSIVQGYLRAKVMPTPFDDDHIRFSWLVVLSGLLSIKSITVGTPKYLKITPAIVMLWLVFYLHLLAAKTGLICLYTTAIIVIAHYIFVRKKWLGGAVILAIVVAFATTAVLTIPTLKNRVQYVVYDYQNYSKGNFIPGLSDAARVLSLKAGWYITLHQPLLGVGFGDMKNAVNQWHQTFQPTSLEYERFLPLNEWLLYGTGSGFPGMLLFTIGIILLIASIWKAGLLEKTISVVLIIPLITDDTLESQFGVVIFIFVIMWLVLHQKIKQQLVS